MKKRMTLSGCLVLTAILIAGLSACNKVDSIIDEPTPQTMDASKTYAMNVTACKGDDASTRVLSLDGKTLNATWAEGETVDVYTVTSGANLEDPSVYTKVGTLTATADGATTTLTGTVTFSGKPRLELYYGSPSWTYEGQKGTLDDISANYDYAMVALTSSKYDITNDVITPTTSPLSFINQQAIVKFTLKNAAGDPISVRSLTLRKAGVKYFNLNHNVTTAATTNDESFTVTRDDASSEFFVAFRPIYDFDIRLETTFENRNYYYERKDVEFNKGKYYEVSVKMNMLHEIDLSKIESNFMAIDGDVLTGELANNVKISIADGATVTLSGANINGVDDTAYKWAGITCLGDATINLDGSNLVKGFHSDYPGIFVPAGKTLTIQGEGSLDASTNGHAAAIGGSKDAACGNIVIAGGTIIATGGAESAGIGCGPQCGCGDITISGGNVTATSESGPGIGGGGKYVDNKCGDIFISGGNIHATGTSGAGIGSQFEGWCGKITITGGTIVALSHSATGAPIGTGGEGSCGNILISGGEVETGYDDYFNLNCAAGIGNGYRGSHGTITITNGITRIKAIAGNDDALAWPIGDGSETKVGGLVTIGGAIVSSKDWDGTGISSDLVFDKSVAKTWLIYNPSKWTP